jgi:hypothetical protein
LEIPLFSQEKREEGSCLSKSNLRIENLVDNDDAQNEEMFVSQLARQVKHVSMMKRGE